MAKLTKPARKTGIAHFFAAAGYSAGGLRRLWGESAFRQEALGMVVVPVVLVEWEAHQALSRDRLPREMVVEAEAL